MKATDEYYLKQDEPIKSCLLALREIILSQGASVTNTMKYGMPFFCYKGKMFCYVWIHKKYKQPYLGIVEGKRVDHPDLLPEKRSLMKILLLDPAKDLPVATIETILQHAISLYKTNEKKAANRANKSA